jgi:hypothetical protein
MLILFYHLHTVLPSLFLAEIFDFSSPRAASHPGLKFYSFAFYVDILTASSGSQSSTGNI